MALPPEVVLVKPVRPQPRPELLLPPMMFPLAALVKARKHPRLLAYDALVDVARTLGVAEASIRLDYEDGTASLLVRAVDGSSLYAYAGPEGAGIEVAGRRTVEVFRAATAEDAATVLMLAASPLLPAAIASLAETVTAAPPAPPSIEDVLGLVAQARSPREAVASLLGGFRMLARVFVRG